jgi:hypothetical protein
MKNKKLWLPIEARTGNYARVDFPVEANIYEADYIIDGISLNVSEYDADGACICECVPFQFDAGSLTFLMTGETPANTTRYYRFEAVRDGGSRRSYINGEPLVGFSSGVIAHGYPSWKIKNKNAELIFDRCGGAFSEMIDKDGGDWIQYDNAEPPVCYRGIPNMQTYAGDYNWKGLFHPGYGTVTSKMIFAGPLKIKIFASTDTKASGASTIYEDTRWELVYEIFPDFVRCTVLKGDEEGFAFLYEGVPGGKTFDKSKQYCVNSQNEKFYFSENVTNDVKPKWVYFGEDGLERTLYYAYLEEKSQHEKIYQVFDALTVFGFGRETIPGIIDFPATFTFGFCESGEFDKVAAAVNGVYQPLEVMTGTFRE